MSWAPIKEIARQVKSGETTAVEQVGKSLRLIDDANEYNAIISLVDGSLERANEIDQQIKEGQDVGELAGVPFIVKDNFLVKGSITTAASNILDGYKAPYTATSVQRLEEAGAIVVAKANLDSFAHGSSTENSDYGPTKNPHDKTKVPGGSSGGSAAAVVLGLAPFALGSDTGGSIRQPASFTGSVGLKPTYGLVSRYGVVAMASSTDVIGPITNNVADAGLVLDVMSGKDDRDSTTINRDDNPYQDLKADLSGVTFGVIEEHLGAGIDSPVGKSINEAIDLVEKAGAKTKKVTIPALQMALSAYYIIMPAEVSSNLSRYDGIRYGKRSKQSTDIESTYLNTRGEGFNHEVKRRILIGTYVLSSGYYDAYYKKAQTVRTKLIEEFNQVMSGVDILIGPTSPTTAFALGANTQDPLSMYKADVMTVGANLIGNPAISIPSLKTDSMPIGLQLKAAQNDDRRLLAVANEVEKLIKEKS